MPSAAPAENLGGGPHSRSGRPVWKGGSAPAPHARGASRAPNTGWKKNISLADPLDALPTRRRRPVARAGPRPQSPASGDPQRGPERGARAARRLHLGSRQCASGRRGESKTSRSKRTSHRPQRDDRAVAHRTHARTRPHDSRVRCLGGSAQRPCAGPGAMGRGRSDAATHRPPNAHRGPVRCPHDPARVCERH